MCFILRDVFYPAKQKLERRDSETLECVVFLIVFSQCSTLNKFYDKLRLSSLAKRSFKMKNNIDICVIHGSIQTGLKKYIFS